jgi:hypothetical protein
MKTRHVVYSIYIIHRGVWNWFWLIQAPNRTLGMSPGPELPILVEVGITGLASLAPNCNDSHNAQWMNAKEEEAIPEYNVLIMGLSANVEWAA